MVFTYTSAFFTHPFTIYSKGDLLMSIDTLNGVVGQAAHFAGDYLFRNVALPNNTTIQSEEHILNNTLGKLLLVGTIDKNLSLTESNALTVLLQYKDGSDWKTLSTLLSVSEESTIPAGQIFSMIPVPSNTKRIHRLQITTNFDASAVKLTAVIESMPLVQKILLPALLPACKEKIAYYTSMIGGGEVSKSIKLILERCRQKNRDYIKLFEELSKQSNLDGKPSIVLLETNLNPL